MTEEKIDIELREAIPEDASAIIQFLEAAALETGFLSMGAEGLGISPEEEAVHLERILKSENNILLVALLGDEVIATGSVSATDKPKLRHIGEIGVAVAKDYWGFGLGTSLVDELIYWSQETGIIRRLELTVQTQNQRAIHVYTKLGFSEEAIMPRGVFEQGKYLDVCLMSKMIDKV